MRIINNYPNKEAFYERLLETAETPEQFRSLCKEIGVKIISEFTRRSRNGELITNFTLLVGGKEKWQYADYGVKALQVGTRFSRTHRWIA